jgi:hypothetical protein
MTLKQAQQLIDGEVYLFKYEDKAIKRMFKEIRNTINNFTKFKQYYLLLTTYEPTPQEFLFRLDDVDLIEVYRTPHQPQKITIANHSERDGE